MNRAIPAILLALIILNVQTEVWSQQVASPPAAPGISFGTLGTLEPGNSVPSSVLAPVSNCEGCGNSPGACGCDDGFTYSSPCTGACGGICAGGCGSKHGIFGGILGRHHHHAHNLGSGFWGEVEYLLWWTQDRTVPVLATTSPTGTPFNVAGRLGQPTTSVLYGGEVDGSPYHGIRLSGGVWIDDHQAYGIGSRAFYIDGEDDFDANSPGDPILARPFFNTSNNLQDALIVAYPGDTSGRLNISSSNEASGFDIFLRKLLLSGHCNRLDVIGGYQYSNVKDGVDISNSSTFLTGDRFPIDTVIDVHDSFEVDNQFHGGFIGLMLESADGPLSWSGMAKIAFGNMNQEASISGSSTTTIPGAGSDTVPYGLLALPSNIGTFDQDEFAFIPELNLSVRYNVTNNFQLLAGYSFIYWSKVALSGELIDLNVNPTQVDNNPVGPLTPTAPTSLKSDGFWYTGLSLGGAVRF